MARSLPELKTIYESYFQNYNPYNPVDLQARIDELVSAFSEEFFEENALIVVINGYWIFLFNQWATSIVKTDGELHVGIRGTRVTYTYSYGQAGI